MGIYIEGSAGIAYRRALPWECRMIDERGIEK
jgi:hypothetical protein